MAEQKAKRKTFDLLEYERRAIACERISNDMSLTAPTRAYYAGRAKTFRRLLEITDRLWPKTGKSTTNPRR